MDNNQNKQNKPMNPKSEETQPITADKKGNMETKNPQNKS